MNSLVSKVLFVKHLITRSSMSIVAVCKPWLIPSVSSSFVAIDGFQVVRGDCSNLTRKHSFVCMLRIFCSVFRLKFVCSMSLLCLTELDICCSSLYTFI